MDANEVNMVIDNICNKIGIGADYAKDFVPYLAKYKIVNSAGCFLAATVILVAFGIVIGKLYKKYKTVNEYDKEDWMIGIVVMSVPEFLAFVFAAYTAIDAITWLLTPEAKAVEYIMQNIQ